MAGVKAQAAEAEAYRIAEEELAAAAAKGRAILATAKTAAGEVGMELDDGSLSKQKGQAEGEWTVCDCYMMWGFDCQVSLFLIFFFDFLLMMGR